MNTEHDVGHLELVELTLKYHCGTLFRLIIPSLVHPERLDKEDGQVLGFWTSNNVSPYLLIVTHRLLTGFHLFLRVRVIAVTQSCSMCPHVAFSYPSDFP
jgi:hypothetical protein